MTETNHSRRKALVAAAVVALVAALGGAGAAALVADVSAKKTEAARPWMQVVEIDDETTDPAVWGKNFPLEYDRYKKTVDMTRTRFGGSEAFPRAPTKGDPRTVVSRQKVEEDPRLSTMWKGYAFAVDFREERGHAYMLEDQTFTQRQVVAKQPGTCIHCHASVYVPYKQAGGGDLIKGFEQFNQLPYAEVREKVEHPVACIDCHEPKTMELRVTRPGFIEGIRAYKASQGVKDYDVNRDATHQEMRAYVCGQCHVEYHFAGKEKRLVYPWKDGLKVDDALAHYDAVGFKDWTHAVTGAPMLKAQHPEFEMWNQGIHARSGVTCADCHMPYMRMGGTKVADHWVRSPMLNINRACQQCHNWSEDELRGRVEGIQARHYKLRNQALDAVVALVSDIEAAKANGASEAELTTALYLHRRATFLLDYAEAENSTGFHAPQEAARILGEAIDFARQGQIAVRDFGYQPTAEVAEFMRPDQVAGQ